MRIVAGLGNPGEEYAGTPHNMGFEVVELLAGRHEAAWRRQRRLVSRTASAALSGVGRVLFVEPQTFMNLSGSGVAAAVNYYGCALTDLVVVLDDVDLPPGRIRIRPGGGSGGHRGLASVIEALGSNSFPRVRVGIGRGSGDAIIRHVLESPDAETRESLRAVIGEAADAVHCLLRHGVAEAMNRYNGRRSADEGGSDSGQTVKG